MIYVQIDPVTGLDRLSVASDQCEHIIYICTYIYIYIYIYIIACLHLFDVFSIHLFICALLRIRDWLRMRVRRFMLFHWDIKEDCNANAPSSSSSLLRDGIVKLSQTVNNNIDKKVTPYFHVSTRSRCSSACSDITR